MSLYRRPGSPFYWSKLYSDGDVVRFSTRERTRVRALQVERDEAAKLKERRKLAGRYTLKILGIKFLDAKEAASRANGRGDPAETTKMRRKHLRLIGAFFGPDVDPRTIDADACEAFKADRMKRVGAVTVCKELSTLRQMLKFAASQKVLTAAPAVKNPEHSYTPKWRILAPDELVRFLVALAGTRSREVYPWALLRANTGMRPTETTKLRWEMVNFRDCQVDIDKLIAKTRKARSVPLNEGALEALWLLAIQRGPGPAIGRMFTEEHHYSAWRAAREAAKVGAFRPHDLRHTLASSLHAARVPWPVVRDILGHLTMDMVNRYAHTFDRQQADALQGISVSVPAGVPLVGRGVPRKGAKGQIVGGGK